MTITLGQGVCSNCIYYTVQSFHANNLCKPCSQVGWPCCHDEVQDAIESYFEQLSINIVKTMSQSVKCENYKIVMASKVNFSHTV